MLEIKNCKWLSKRTLFWISYNRILFRIDWYIIYIVLSFCYKTSYIKTLIWLIMLGEILWEQTLNFIINIPFDYPWNSASFCLFRLVFGMQRNKDYACSWTCLISNYRCMFGVYVLTTSLASWSTFLSVADYRWSKWNICFRATGLGCHRFWKTEK